MSNIKSLFKIAHIAILVACFLPNLTFATVSYTRTPSDFYAGHGSFITLSSDDQVTDFGDCLEVYMQNMLNGSYYVSMVSATSSVVVVPILDNQIWKSISYQPYTFGLGESDCTSAYNTFLGSVGSEVFVEGPTYWSDANGPNINTLTIFSTFPVTSSGGSGTTTINYATTTSSTTDNPALDWFLALSMFLIGFFGMVWLIRKH